MTPEEFENQIKEIFKGNYDIEEAHFEADCLMTGLLISLGYQKGVEIFDTADKWYA